MIAFEQVGDTDHHIKGGVVVTALGKGAAVQGIAQVEEIQFREPVALLKGSQGVILLASQFPEIGGAAARPLDQRTEEGSDALKEDEQRSVSEAPKGSDSPSANQPKTF